MTLCDGFPGIGVLCFATSVSEDFLDTEAGFSDVNVLTVAHSSLGTRPFARGRRKGSGHHLTFELSPGRNVDLTNQKR